MVGIDNDVVADDPLPVASAAQPRTSSPRTGLGNAWTLVAVAGLVWIGIAVTLLALRHGLRLDRPQGMRLRLLVAAAFTPGSLAVAAAIAVTVRAQVQAHRTTPVVSRLIDTARGTALAAIVLLLAPCILAAILYGTAWVMIFRHLQTNPAP